MSRPFYLLCFVVLLAGCATPEPTDGQARINPRDVKIFKAPPHVAYEAVGKVTYSHPYSSDEMHGSGLSIQSVGSGDALLDGLRERAARMGGDGIIITDRHRVQPADGPNEMYSSTMEYISGTVIRFQK